MGVSIHIIIVHVEKRRITSIVLTGGGRSCAQQSIQSRLDNTFTAVGQELNVGRLGAFTGMVQAKTNIVGRVSTWLTDAGAADALHGQQISLTWPLQRYPTASARRDGPLHLIVGHVQVGVAAMV